MNLPNYVQNFVKYFIDPLIFAKVVNFFCLSGEMSPNLVTLVAGRVVRRKSRAFERNLRPEKKLVPNRCRQFCSKDRKKKVRKVGIMRASRLNHTSHNPIAYSSMEIDSAEIETILSLLLKRIWPIAFIQQIVACVNGP